MDQRLSLSASTTSTRSIQSTRSTFADPRIADPPLTLTASSSYNIFLRSKLDRRVEKIMHPPVTIMTVLLCVAFCLRPTEFDPARIVARSFNAVSRRRKK